MAIYDNTLTGSGVADTIVATPGTNLIHGSGGSETIIALDGVNTIEFNLGDALDTIEYAPPRTYQYADFLVYAKNALQDLDSFTGTNYGNANFANADRLLVNSLPPEISQVLAQFGMQSKSDGAQQGSVDPDLARATFEALIAWINAPTSNVIQFGDGITPADIQLQPGGTMASYGLPAQFTITVNGQRGIQFELGRPDRVAGSTDAKPNLDIQFRFANGMVITAAQLFAGPASVTNHAPEVAVAAVNQTAVQDQAFSYKLQNNSFIDIDQGDQLKLSAKLASGDRLPGWLKFDAATGTFSGTPANADVGNVNVVVTATDLAGATASTAFSLTVANVNDAPTVTVAAANQAATQDHAFNYTVAADTFTDIDVGDQLKLSAKLASGDPLPGWLKFDAATGTFSGTPANADVGNVNVVVTATDLAGAIASTGFSIAVTNVNDAPTVCATVCLDQSTQAGKSFSMTVPANMFQDIDLGDKLMLSAELVDGSALPSWLKFDADTRTFSGVPTGAGVLDVRLTATDLGGASATDAFRLTINESTPAGMTLIGTRGKDTLVGGDGNDTLNGGRGRDVLLAEGGDDSLLMSHDGTWHLRSMRVNVGSVGNGATYETVSIDDKVRSRDTFDGGTGYDMLKGTSASDAILLDDPRKHERNSGPRIRNVERIDAGAGDDVVDLTSSRYSYGDITIDGGDGNDLIWSSSGDDVLLGGNGNDTIRGGAGNDYLLGGAGQDDLDGGPGTDVLQGGSGNDRLTDRSGNGLLDGGAGDDTISDGWSRNLIAGGIGNDVIKLGGGADVIAFDRGDGRDLIQSGERESATLSLGRGIRISDLMLRHSGNSLVLDCGRGDQITFEGWYRGSNYQPISTLQLINIGIIAGSDVQTVNFRSVVNAFDRSHSGVSGWSVSDAIAQFHGSNAGAIGGDLAYQYASAGSLAGVGMAAVLATTGSDQFGFAAQSITNSNLKDGAVKLA